MDLYGFIKFYESSFVGCHADFINKSFIESNWHLNELFAMNRNKLINLSVI